MSELQIWGAIVTLVLVWVIFGVLIMQIDERLGTLEKKTKNYKTLEPPKKEERDDVQG